MSQPTPGTSSGPAPVRVDVVVVSWNVRDRLRTCLAGLLEACPGLELDVVVVDNASGDGSAEMVAAEFPSVQLERNAANVLYAPAVVQGARRGESPLLLLLNPDCELAASQLLELVRVLEGLRACGGRAPAVPRRWIHPGGPADHPGFWSPLFFGTPLEHGGPTARSPEVVPPRPGPRGGPGPQPPAACFPCGGAWEDLGGRRAPRALQR